MHRKDGEEGKRPRIEGEAHHISKAAEIPKLNFLLEGLSFLKEANTWFVRGNGCITLSKVQLQNKLIQHVQTFTYPAFFSC